MSKPRTFVATFTGATRHGLSVNGNPTWILHTDAGNHRTQTDAALGYEVSNHTHSRLGLIGKRVEFTATAAGRVFAMKEI